MASDSSTQVLLDDETGELDQMVICLRSASLTCPDYDLISTCEREVHHPDWRRSFRIPAEACTQQGRVKVHRDVQINGVDLALLNCNTLIALALLLPPLLLFPAWAGIAAALSEAAVHIWSHKRNRHKNGDDPVFRSPFNLITSEFCAKCRTEKWMTQIGKMQDKRSLRRNLIDPAFIKQVVR